ncbi:hypothetical protein DUNSADRAFT_17258 [Dunaliella salina]|uniref:Encoded protein n=1 Tax=Dunaliella salina TaxID=3046 RepID=A0ABQ7H0B4_DUNSA|nr:hypothetical protein DUNSADRAFT_17258 [Dunaliella salina]|eukprot:KAF5840289.1 hypothetical protein DUNSADRAFT_17258 [Dunaliella salina]
MADDGDLCLPCRPCPTASPSACQNPCITQSDGIEFLALPNGVPLSRLDYTHTVESNRVASALHRRATIHQEYRGSPGSKSAPAHAFPDPHPHPTPYSLGPITRTTTSATPSNPTSATPANRPHWPQPPHLPLQPVQAQAQAQGQAQTRLSSGQLLAGGIQAPAQAPGQAQARLSSGQLLAEGTSGAEGPSGAHSVKGGADSGKALQQQRKDLGSSDGTQLGLKDEQLASTASAAAGRHRAIGEPGTDGKRRGVGAGGGRTGLGYGSILLNDGEAASEVFGGARTLRAGTAEPMLDENFYKTVHRHFLNLTGQQTAELQGDLNVSLPEIIESFGISSTT